MGWRKAGLLVKAFSVLLAYKSALFVFPFRYFITPHSTVRTNKPSVGQLNEVVWAVQVVSRRVPFGFTCLVQALSVRWLLRSHPAIELKIGVHKSETGQFTAHAWVEHNQQIIIGEQSDQAFTPILTWT
ncbi:hypothetical protein AWR27_02090 [Spirosoma montaniterrae]|uniref:Microcin J25-processing protein McjB C-terminal domain-containing protein n=1 Tax=Spirosoma montaniterrae TaxID=1178516 RepID=A0A1P9X3Q0_9BACT|nr:hypothetical protein AWR27_02090 [Spirosoma montaniterrae]